MMPKNAPRLEFLQRSGSRCDADGERFHWESSEACTFPKQASVERQDG